MQCLLLSIHYIHVMLDPYCFCTVGLKVGLAAALCDNSGFPQRHHLVIFVNVKTTFLVLKLENAFCTSITSVNYFAKILQPELSVLLVRLQSLYHVHGSLLLIVPFQFPHPTHGTVYHTRFEIRIISTH